MYEQDADAFDNEWRRVTHDHNSQTRIEEVDHRHAITDGRVGKKSKKPKKPSYYVEEA